MSEKHFIALADAVRQHNEQATRDNESYTKAFTEDQLFTLAVFCGDQNLRFNRQRWLDYIDGKCGPNGGAR